MNWPMILRRNRYYKAHLVSIFLSMCVVLILPVLYETYTANAAERYVRQTLADQPLRNQFIMLWNDTPPPDVDADADHAQLGELLVQTRRFSLANGIQCGLTYETGAVITGLSEASLNCYTILAYPDQDIDTYFTLVDGRMPVHLQRPQQAAGYMGAPDAEAVITQTAAERSKLTVGQRIVYNEEVTQARIIEIVGIVRLNDPDLPFWRSQTILTNGVYTPVGSNLRYDFGLMVPAQTFDETITSVAPAGVMAVQELETDVAVIHADNLDQWQTTLLAWEQHQLQVFPSLEITNTLRQTIHDLARDIEVNKAPVFWLTLALAGFLLAQLLYITLLALNRQAAEWQLLRQEGWSASRLLLLHLSIVFVPVFAATVLIALIAYPSWVVLLISSAFALGVIAVALPIMLWQWEKAIQGRLLLQYGADVVLGLAGVAFLLRLYLITERGQDLDIETINTLANAIGFVLITFGASLLIVRVVRLLVSRIPIVFAWILVTTLLVGGMGLAAHRVYARSIWDQAVSEVGAEVRIQFGDSIPAEDWTALSGVQSYETQLRLEDSGRQITLVGVTQDADGLPDPPPQKAGVILPDDATELALQLYVNALVDDFDMALDISLRDNAGIPFAATMQSPDALAVDHFNRYSVVLPAPYSPPWRWETLTLVSRREETTRLDYTVYVDDLRITTPDGEAVLLEGFESLDLTAWQFLDRTEGIVVSRTVNPAFEGNASLQIAYKIFNNARTATVSLPINPVKSTPIPALVSANVLAVLNTGSRDPAVGDTGTLEMRLPLGTTQLEFEIVGILDQFDGLAADTRFIVAPITYLLPAVNARNALDQHYAPNTLYLHLADQEPSAALRDALKPYHARYAWDIQHTLEQQSFRKVAIELLIRGFGLMLFVTTLAFVINKVGTSP